MQHVHYWSRAALLGGLIAVNANLHATAADGDADTLEQRVRILERKQEIAEESSAAKAKETPTVSASAKDGFALTAADKSYQIKLRGIVQADGRFFLSDGDERLNDSFLVRRARPIIEGKFANDFDFRIMPDFAGSQTVLFDAYGGYTYAPWLKLRAGKFKPPVGLERLQSASDTTFIERGHPTSLVPNRDVGLQVFGDLFGETVSYAGGVFNGIVDGGNGDSDNNDEKDFAGRLVFSPFKQSSVPVLTGLSVGIAATTGDHQGTTTSPSLPSYRSIGQQSIFSFKTSTNAADAVIADGDNVRFVPQATWYYRTVGLLAEYAQSSHDVTKGKNSATLDNDALLAEITFVLTGEDASYKGVVPDNPFAPRNGHWGALELALRYSELNVDDAAFQTYADPARSVKGTQTVGFGLNWYLNKNLKAALNFDNSTFDGGAAKGADRDDEQALFTRVQLSF